ncbi:conserved hypothetical protein [uncultured Eubacteriales bacterium]|uniref:DUF3793 family protein n=1 Tax=uncultured Eubacteriales bacterium TaxID=172733 RepID=A0A212KGP4_9FIRM|nr:conserved hypothetical protein [uncultured Eubacteriales bacterium]
MLERHLIEHCSPTLASLKTASLFSIACADEEALRLGLEEWNAQFCGKGVELLALRRQEGKALVYVCRKSRLERDLGAPGVPAFLASYGYARTDAEYALGRLKARLAESSGFPHEIGLFLGYPLGDVIGFIENAGQNSKCCGCWKVYCNECEARRTFALFEKCRDVYLRLWSQGRSVMQLTVAA